MTENPPLELACQFIESTNRNLFITGRAGTGKTTFLHKIQMESKKRMVVVAPTGVAAINARGTTIHSFFQLPFGPITPNHINENQQHKFHKTKIDIIKSLDLLIIDEISMVRADILDGINTVLRRYKNGQLPFGGVQIVMIGDLQQLSPVVKHNEWDILKNYYKNAYFFSSHSYQEANVLPIEFKHIYRQTNEDFISILNEVRNNCLSEKNLHLLEKRHQPAFSPKAGEGYITLTTHNRKATSINNKELEKLTTRNKTYNASITGNFYENNYPNKEELLLKIGAQVMFIKNDSSPEKRYYNGKIGIVTALDKNTVSVKCDDEIIEAGVETWENIKYTLHKDTQEISEKIDGTYTQIPLRLAWAITIHKSQGLTFDKAIIDAESAFAHGQTYVALSRCRTLEGLVLKTPIRSESIINDKTVDSFIKIAEESEPNEKILESSKKAYQLQLLNEIFNFYSFLKPLQRLIDIYYSNQNSFTGNIIQPLLEIKDKGVIPLIKINTAFTKQLKQLTENSDNLEESDIVQERFKKALSYFNNHVQQHISTPYEQLTYSTENKTLKKDFEKQLSLLESQIVFKTFCTKNVDTHFNTENYLSIRAKGLLEQPARKKKEKMIIPSSHIELFEELQMLRKVISNSENIPPFQVFTQKTLYELCEKLPITEKQLKKINGMEKVRITKYGDEIIEIIKEYCEKNNITTEKDPIKSTKNTKEISLELFIQGLSAKEIAEKRGLVIGTIETHLAHFISTGQLEIQSLMPEEKIAKGLAIVNHNTFDGLTELRELTGEEYSFSELRMLIKHLEFQKNNPQSGDE